MRLIGVLLILMGIATIGVAVLGFAAAMLGGPHLIENLIGASLLVAIAVAFIWAGRFAWRRGVSVLRRLLCDGCRISYKLLGNCVVVPFFEVASDFGISGNDVEDTTPEAPDLISICDWSTVDPFLRREQRRTTERLRRILRNGKARWWKCSNCGKVHSYPAGMR